MRKILLGAAALMMMSGAAMADTTIELVLKDHKFSLPEIKVKARESFVISLTNQDAQAEEFDSPALKAEKVVAGKGHEPGQTIAGVVHPFDDAAETAAALISRGGLVGDD